MNPGIKKITKDIHKMIDCYSSNTKMAEEMCQGIGFHLEKAGELSDKLSKCLSNIGKGYSDYFEHNKIRIINNVCSLYQTTSEVVAEIGDQMKKTSKIFSSELRNMISFGSYENEGLLNLILTRNSYVESYEEAKINLERKKVLLLDQTDIRKWGIDPAKLKLPVETLLKSPDLAKKYMLPQVT